MEVYYRAGVNAEISGFTILFFLCFLFRLGVRCIRVWCGGFLRLFSWCIRRFRRWRILFCSLRVALCFLLFPVLYRTLRYKDLLQCRYNHILLLFWWWDCWVCGNVKTYINPSSVQYGLGKRGTLRRSKVTRALRLKPRFMIISLMSGLRLRSSIRSRKGFGVSRLMSLTA